MKTLRIHNLVALFVGAVVLVFQVSPARAGGDLEAEETNQERRMNVTFTKWLLSRGLNPGFMTGFTGRDVEGTFVGETFVNVTSTNPDMTKLSSLEVIYEVQARNPERSFTALIRGGASLGRAQLDGRIVTGWRIGAPVHVEWVRYPSPSRVCPPPPADGAGPYCFVGTITIEPVAPIGDPRAPEGQEP